MLFLSVLINTYAIHTIIAIMPITAINNTFPCFASLLLSLESLLCEEYVAASSPLSLLTDTLSADLLSEVTLLSFTFCLV